MDESKGSLECQLSLLEDYLREIEMSSTQKKQLIQRADSLVASLKTSESSDCQRFADLSKRFEDLKEQYSMKEDQELIVKGTKLLDEINKKLHRSLQESDVQEAMKLTNEIMSLLDHHRGSECHCKRWRQVASDALQTIALFYEIEGVRELTEKLEETRDLRETKDPSEEEPQKISQSHSYKKCSYDESPLISLKLQLSRRTIKTIECESFQQQPKKKKSNPIAQFFSSLFSGILYPCTSSPFDQSEINQRTIE